VARANGYSFDLRAPHLSHTTSPDTLDSQAGLFAAFLSAFLIELLNRLEQDPTDVIQDILIHQTYMMRNSSLGPYVPTTFSPPDHIVAVNALFYASLGVMLLAALIAMLIKSWVREFDRGLRGMSVPEQRAKTREFRHQGLLRWKLPEMVATLPLLIQFSLLLFTIGLSLFLSNVSMPSCGVVTVILGIGAVFYAVTTSISVLVSSSPFRSPLSRALHVVYQRVLSQFLPSVADLMSAKMDLPPTTWLMSLQRQLQVFFYEFRPYSEGDFVKPFSDLPEDPMQLNYAAAALEWLYNSTPDSQESISIHQAVLHIVGSGVFRARPQLKMPQEIMWWYRKIDGGHAPQSASELCTLACVQLRFIDEGEHSADLTVHLDRRTPSPWNQLVTGVDRLIYQYRHTHRSNPRSIVKSILSNNFSIDELLWLVDTISQLWLSGSLEAHKPKDFVDMCYSVLFSLNGPRRYVDVHEVKVVLLLNAVMTLAAMILVPDDDLLVLPRVQHHDPWLLPSFRRLELLARMVDSARSNEKVLFHANHLFFLLFLFLLRRSSLALASQFFDLMVRDDPFADWAGVLAKHSIRMAGSEILLIMRLLMRAKEQRLQLLLDHTAEREPDIDSDGEIDPDGEDHVQDVLERYDEQLGESKDPEPTFLVALLSIDPESIQNTGSVQPQILKNPWCTLAAQAFAGEEPDELISLPETWNAHIIPNLIAAANLRAYSDIEFDTGPALQLLTSCFQSHEYLIIQSAFWKYLVAIRDNLTLDDILPLPPHFCNAVQTIFNSHLPQHEVVQGWEILGWVLGQWDIFPSEWQQEFVTSFFSRSSRQLPSMRGDLPDLPDYSGDLPLERILTFDYMKAMKRRPQFVDSSGMDWFMALSAILRARPKDGETEGRYNPAKLESMVITAQEVLDAFQELLSVTPDTLFVLSLPQIKIFIHQFDEADALIFSRVYTRIHSHDNFSCALHFD
jgi:hypothetical protein